MTNKIIEIKEACRLIKEIMAPLEKERRVDILKILPTGEIKTFSQIQVQTNIPASSLHDHLKVLVELGYIRKTDDRPARYFRNEYVDKLCELATYWRARKLEELTKKMAEYQQSDETKQELGCKC